MLAKNSLTAWKSSFSRYGKSLRISSSEHSRCQIGCQVVDSEAQATNTGLSAHFARLNGDPWIQIGHSPAPRYLFRHLEGYIGGGCYGREAIGYPRLASR